MRAGNGLCGGSPGIGGHAYHVAIFAVWMSLCHVAVPIPHGCPCHVAVFAMLCWAVAACLGHWLWR